MQIIAILSSDWHLSLKPPIARSAEPDWFAAMKRPLKELQQLQTLHKNAIMICAGDYFHHWNEPAQLINFAIKYAPVVYGIPGQHDLPHHNYSDIQKSSYWTMVKTGKIGNLPRDNVTRIGDLELWGFPWGSPLTPLKDKSQNLRLAVIHKYIWMPGATHGGKPNKADNVKEFSRELRGFDAAVVGDNHIEFQCLSNGVNVFNCGSLMSRNSDQRNYSPGVGLLNEDGSIDRHCFDTTKDKWLEENQVKELEEKVDLSGLLKDFKKISAKTINFFEMLEQALKSDKVSEDAKGCLINILEEIR